MTGKLILLFMLLTAGCRVSLAQKVFAVEYASQADLKVFVVQSENQADLKFFFVKYENQAGWRNKSRQPVMY